MKSKLYIFLLAALSFTQSCIDLENEPLVATSPSVNFQAHIRGNQLYVTATIYANPEFIDPGNIPTYFNYSGSIELYNEITGELVGNEDIIGDGLSTVVEVTGSANSFENTIIIIDGTVTAFADKDSDGKTRNDIQIHKSEFYQFATVAEVIKLQQYPIVNLNPTVTFQSYISGVEFYAVSMINANPEYITPASYPILYKYTGVLQIFDKTSGSLIRSKNIEGSGLSNSVTIVSDTASYYGFIVIASGKVESTGDIESDGPSANDIFISEADFYSVLEVDLTQ